jgi:hypothetical protein
VKPVNFNPYDDFIFFDSCAFDGGSPNEQLASKKARKILDENNKKVMIMHSVASEIRNSNTPDWLQEIEPKSRQTVKLNLTPKEKSVLSEIEQLIVGNGKLEKRKADCFHVFEAQKYGGCFVTSDVGIYKHSEAIDSNYGLKIIKPSEFLELVREYSIRT